MIGDTNHQEPTAYELSNVRVPLSHNQQQPITILGFAAEAGHSNKPIARALVLQLSVHEAFLRGKGMLRDAQRIVVTSKG